MLKLIIIILFLIYIIICLDITGKLGRYIKFKLAYDIGYWKLGESKSGTGSDLKNTRVISTILPEIIQKYKINSFIDGGCGDMFWMKNVLEHPYLNNLEYLGIDLILGEINNKRFPKYKFKKLDLIEDELPSYDMILIRDVFIHLDNNQILKCLNNLKSSGIKYLLSGSGYKKVNKNNNLFLHARDVDLSKYPYNLNVIESYNSDGFDQNYQLIEL